MKHLIAASIAVVALFGTAVPALADRTSDPFQSGLSASPTFTSPCDQSHLVTDPCPHQPLQPPQPRPPALHPPVRSVKAVASIAVQAPVAVAPIVLTYRATVRYF